MSTASTDALTVGGLGLGAAYLNWVATYGTSVVTTLAILIAVVTLVSRVQEFLQARGKRKKKETTGDGPDNDDTE